MTAKQQGIARTQPAALARPSFIKEGDMRGTENITSADIKPPALKIAQSTSKETKKHEVALFIEGLTEGNFFNSSTREIYGEGPLRIVIINQLGHRHVEFDPNDKNVVLDFNVPDGDPRTEFTTQRIDGKDVRVKPRATKFYDYLIFILTDNGREMVTMSLKSTQLKKAVQLNTKLAGSKMPSFAHLFEASVVPETKGGNYYGWRFDPVGYVDEETYNEASAKYDQMKGKKIEVSDADGGEEETKDDIPF